MNELFQRIEQEFPRLRRYARALTRDPRAPTISFKTA